jgi:hypothetical protein
MRHPVRLYVDLDDDLYDATPNCGEIPKERRLQLEIVDTHGTPEGQWACEACCPADIYYPARTVLRLPSTFHIDEDCPMLTEDRERGRPVGDVWLSWPMREYRDIVESESETWIACARCISSRSVLHPLGSPARPSKAA